MIKLTKKHIFEQKLKGLPIQQWLPTTVANDPENMAACDLLFETGIYELYTPVANELASNSRTEHIRITYPMTVYWQRKENMFGPTV